MTFGEKLRKARKAKNLTQKMLAKQINAAHNSISNWENDQNMPDPDTIEYLCWALDVQPNYFFDVNFSDKKEAPTSTEDDVSASNLSTEDKIRITFTKIGLLDENKTLSDSDLTFLQHMFLAIQAHFEEH